jgi:hypothetical protein
VVVHGWKWKERTRPFSAIGSPDEPACFVVEQVDDACFAIPAGAGFEYRPSDGGPPIVVDSTTLPLTDFASIPTYVSWFVTRYGRHTPAALVHDQLIADGVSNADRVRADDLFLEMMEHLDVPVVRRSVMWAAVTMATRWCHGMRGKVTLVGWGATATGGLVLLVAGAARRRWRWAALALLLPIPASAWWGRHARAGLIAGYALIPVVLPAAFSAGGYGTYWLVEEAVRRGTALVPNRHVEQLPQPTPFRER